VPHNKFGYCVLKENDLVELAWREDVIVIISKHSKRLIATANDKDRVKNS